MRDIELRKAYPNVNAFEEHVIQASWSATTIRSPDEVVYQCLYKKEIFEITVKRINGV